MIELYNEMIKYFEPLKGSDDYLDIEKSIDFACRTMEKKDLNYYISELRKKYKL